MQSLNSTQVVQVSAGVNNLPAPAGVSCDCWDALIYAVVLDVGSDTFWDIRSVFCTDADQAALDIWSES